MDTHPPNPDPQQPGAQPMAQVAAPSAGEQPAFDVQHAIATLDPKVLMELLENDANPIPPTRQPEPAAQEPPAGEQPPVLPTEPDADPAPATKPKDRLSVRALPDDKRSQIAAFISKLSTGGTDDLVKAALARNASALVIAHNHPSGALTPSRQDEELTRSLHLICSFMHINLLDHLIIGASDQVYSFADQGILARIRDDCHRILECAG